jgi:hypothetical protein
MLCPRHLAIFLKMKIKFTRRSEENNIRVKLCENFLSGREAELLETQNPKASIPSFSFSIPTSKTLLKSQLITIPLFQSLALVFKSLFFSD